MKIIKNNNNQFLILVLAAAAIFLSIFLFSQSPPFRNNLLKDNESAAENIPSLEVSEQNLDETDIDALDNDLEQTTLDASSF